MQRLFLVAYFALLGTCEGVASPLVSQVKAYGGQPALWVNGRPETGLMHWNRVMTPQDVKIFSAAGIHFYSFMGAPKMPNPSGGETSYADGFAHMSVMTTAYLDRMLAMIEENDPEAKVLIRFRLTTPDWWRQAHSNETVRVWDIASARFQSRPWGTPSSPSWRRLMEEAMRRLIRHCEAKWSHRVVGYHPGLACCAENAYDWCNVIADYSPCQLALFKGKVPEPCTYVSSRLDDTNAFLDPVRDHEAIRFMRFQNERMAEAVCFLSHVVKDELARLGRTKVCGAFYGYFCFPANQTEFLSAGHRDFARVLTCPDVDFICAPVDYGARSAGGAALAQTLPASIALHGKLYYAEEDTRFHTALSEPDCVSRTPETTHGILMRNFFNAFSQGGTQWWMDLFGKGWYRDTWYVPELSACQDFAKRHFNQRKGVAQIAVFLSETSIDWERAAPLPFSNELIGMTLSELSACGAPYDLYLLSDLPYLAEKGELTRYRLAVLLNAHAPRESERTQVEKLLCEAGRTVLYLGMPGYVDVGRETASAQNVTAFTGIQVAKTPSRNANVIESFVDGRRISFGAIRRRDPAFTIADTQVEDLGWYVQASDRSHPNVARGVAIARKKEANVTRILSLTSTLPSDILRRFARDAGVHVYSDHGDQVFAGAGWFAVSAKMPGEHTFFARENPNEPIKVALKRGETYLWEDAPETHPPRH